MTDGKDLSDLVGILATARLENRQIHTLDNALLPDSTQHGYDIAEDVTRELGWTPLGWKVAGTTQQVREKLKIDSPIYGRSFRRFRVESPVELDANGLLDPLIECEFFVTLARDLAPRDDSWRYEDILDAVHEVHAGIEVAECRLRDPQSFGLPAILADGAASGRYVYGGLLPAWRDTRRDMPVTLEVDGVLKRSGSGRDVMDDPIAPLHWLAETLRARGMGLKAGEMISTGSCTGMYPARAGQHVVARFGTAASVEIRF
ncbi:2-keto-4-pentenoate hydratase [Minwuia sp.]|uniref:2-keto-4-pentenoate hydratase n=1 Tax=Minwuia sp. TaxID=2493630 RepID=UPI003A8DCB26